VLEETQETEEIIQRVAALDIGKAELTCCVRVPGQGSSGRRLQEVRTYQTRTRWLLVMADRLAELGVTRVVMEATSDYWRGVYYLLEAHGFETWLVNARDVKHLPGRPKTDTLDAVWLCKVAERQLLRPSFVPPRPIRQLRDVTRYRADLVAARTAEKQRVEQAAGWTPRANSRWSLATASGCRGGPCWPRWSPGSGTPSVSRSWPVLGCAPSCRCWRRRSPATSATITRSCWPRCWAGWTNWTPTWPRSTPSSPS
jgi:hypothetical protein